MFLLPLPSVFASLSLTDTDMNDQWYDTLNKIDNEASPDAIINSWWDFGHWFAYYGNRRVTFDGAGQDRHMAYWIGRSLYTNDEKHAAGILRMVDCGNNNAFWKLDSYINNTITSIDILNEIVVMNREKAKMYLTNYITPEQAEQVLEYSHCEPPENYYITSGDMIGKSGAWSHFGAWNFRKSNLVFLATQDKKDEAISFMIEEYGYDRNKAEDEYRKIKALGTGAEELISESRSYGNQITECLGVKNDTLTCPYLIFNIKTEEGIIPDVDGDKYPLRFAFINKNGEFEVKEYNKNLAKNLVGKDIGVVLFERDGKYYTEIMHPELVDSMFTRLHFFEGGAVSCFKLFNHEIQPNKDKSIYTWKINWSCLG